MKKRHSTALQNAWSQKNKHSQAYKMPEDKKQTLSLKKQFWP